jgi:hypothetical protein
MAKEIIEAEIKSNIGEFSKHLDGAKKSAKTLGKETEGVGDASKKAVGGVKKLTVGFKALAKATGFVFIVSKAFEVFQEVLGKNQRLVNAFDIAMESLSLAFNDLFKFVDNNIGTITGHLKALFTDPLNELYKLGQGIQKFFIEQLADVGTVLTSLGKLLTTNPITNPKKFAEAMAGFTVSMGKVKKDLSTTFDEITSSISKYTKGIIENAKETNKLKRAAELAAVVNQGIIEQKDREAELQRQIRDDETNTFAERIAANEQLKVVLEEQEKLMLANAKTAVAYAQTQVAMNDNDANKIALQEALNEQDAIKAQIAGFMSEQLTNQVSLEKELGETKRELLLSGLEGMALELAELQTAYDLKIEMARKAGEDTTAITEKFESDQAAIKKKYEKEKQKWTEMSAEAQLDIMSQTAGNMVKILGEETAAGKAMAVTQATIDTYKGATAAYSAMAGIPYVGPVLGAIAAGAAVASGLANVKAILSADASGGGGGGGAPSTGGASAQAPAPEMLSGKFELGGGVEPEPLKAFVVTDEMTNSQDQLSNIRRRATV